MIVFDQDRLILMKTDSKSRVADISHLEGHFRFQTF